MAALPERLDAVETHAFDITAPNACEGLFESIGAIDHLIVAVRPEVRSGAFVDVDIDEARRAFETKFWGQYRLVQVAARYISETGSIVLTSGIAGERIYRGASTMALINGATETLCRTLAVELGPVRVNCVSPGFVEAKGESVQDYARQFPAGRLGTLDEIASGYLSLMVNPYVTGTINVLDGGARLI